MNFLKSILAFLGLTDNANAVDEALSHFKQAAAKLKAAVDLHALEEKAHDEAIKLREQAKAFAIKEQNRAQRALDKINDFLA